MIAPIIVGVAGYQLNLIEKKLLAHPHLGGVILFARNYQSKQQIKELISSIQAVRYKQNLAPAIIAIDHEGGTVQRLAGPEFTCLPSAEEIGELYQVNAKLAINLIENVATVTAYELGDLGVQVCMGPVLDLTPKIPAKISSRCYSSENSVITTLAKVYISALQSNGLIAVPKHFPGLANQVSDTHYNISLSNISLDELIKHETYPYQELIREGLLKIIALSHQIYSNVDDNPPAGSEKWLKDILRGQFKFKGLIMTDCLQMSSAAVMGMHLKTRITKALKSGCNLILCSHVCDGHYKEIYSALSDKALDSLVTENFEVSSNEGKYNLSNTEYLTAVKNIIEFQSYKDKSSDTRIKASKLLLMFIKKNSLLRRLKSTKAWDYIVFIIYRLMLIKNKLKEKIKWI